MSAGNKNVSPFTLRRSLSWQPSMPGQHRRYCRGSADNRACLAEMGRCRRSCPTLRPKCESAAPSRTRATGESKEEVQSVTFPRLRILSLCGNQFLCHYTTRINNSPEETPAYAIRPGLLIKVSAESKRFGYC